MKKYLIANERMRRLDFLCCFSKRKIGGGLTWLGGRFWLMETEKDITAFADLFGRDESGKSLFVIAKLNE